MRRSDGLTMIELMIVVTIIAIIAAVAIPLMSRNRIAANEASAVAGLRAIAHAEMTFHHSHGEYADFEDLSNATPPYLSDSNVASGLKDGYEFDVLSATSSGFEALASPIAFGKTGNKTFYIDESGIVRFSEDGSQPDSASPEWQ